MNESYDSNATEAQIPLDPFQTCTFNLSANTIESGQPSHAEVSTSQSSRRDNVLFITHFSN